MTATPSANNRIWDLRKDKLIQQLKQCAHDSPVMTLEELHDLGDEVRAITRFETKTLVKLPGREVELMGPVWTGIRYHQSFQSKAPIPWEVVTILFPLGVYHPNVNPNGGLCLGKPPANVPMDLILHMTWAALVLNTRLVTTTDWRVFNPAAAAYVRSHKDQFPLTDRGLFEQTIAQPDAPKPDPTPDPNSAENAQ